MQQHALEYPSFPLWAKCQNQAEPRGGFGMNEKSGLPADPVVARWRDLVKPIDGLRIASVLAEDEHTALRLQNVKGCAIACAWCRNKRLSDHARLCVGKAGGTCLVDETHDDWTPRRDGSLYTVVRITFALYRCGCECRQSGAIGTWRAGVVLKVLDEKP